MMRAALENRLNAIWYEDHAPPWYLRAMVPIYRMLLALDRNRGLRDRAKDLESKSIIVVGNLTSGGSGKTPLVVRLCELFLKAGMSPAVISRGYGRDDRKRRLVIPASNPLLVGDEPLLIAKRCNVPVMVGPSRVESARELFEHGANVIISDDGLQHHSLPRAIEICVVDGERGFGNGCLLPAGPLRESAQRLKTVDYVVVNGGKAGQMPRGTALEDIDWVRMDLQPRKVTALNGKLSWRLAQFSGCRVNAIAGISNPQRFFDLLRSAGIEPEERAFPDHHRFTAEDFIDLPNGLPILMTEKDAVKCKDFELENAWYLSVDAFLPSDWENQVVDRVLDCIDDG